MKQKIADLINVIFGFRKFLAWLALFLIAVFFRYFNYLDGGQFVDLMKTTFMGFVAGNGVEHLVSIGKEYINSKNPNAPAMSDNLVEGDEK